MKKKKKSLQKKIAIVAVQLTLSSLLVVSLVAFFMFLRMRSDFIESSETAGGKASVISAVTMEEQIEQSLQLAADGQAKIADHALQEFQNSVKIMADTVTRMYDNPDSYGVRQVPLPDASMDGKLSPQLLFSEKTDQNDPAIQKELGLLANGQDTLLSINESDPNMVSNYIASESGIMIQADYISAKKFDENGNILPYEAADRPWYKGAKETGKPFFTSLSRDAHTSGVGIMCGVPFYKGDEFMGVAGAGMYLDDLEKAVVETKVGENGYACLIDGEGQVIFSSGGGKIFSSEPEQLKDLRKSNQTALADLITKAVDGERGIDLLDLDGVSSYVAYAPLETVGWSFLTIISSEEVNQPTEELVSMLKESTEETVTASYNQIRFMIIMFIVIIFLLSVVALILSRRASRMLVRQVSLLTTKVSEIKGDNLDFVWEEDTGDEIQVLAESFGSLTERMKQYIRDITEITKEKERIGAELNVATRIQASMLPADFNEFDGLGHFTLFASMDPAKEVGGDFYDFFLVDGEHIALVMADVSGKGVPAALFMVRAMTAIRTRALMGGGPSDILSDVNDQLCVGNEEELFVTVWLAILNFKTGEGLAANAGHEHPALCHEGGAYELVKYRHGAAVATMEGLPFREHEFRLEPGDTVFVYTDGVTEATDANNELFGEERLVTALNTEPGASPEKLLPIVRAGIDTFVGEAPQFDDITMMAFHYFGKRD